MKPKRKRDHQGVALLIIIGILMAISVAGVSFARLATLESKAAQNYSLKMQSRLVALAGIDYAIAQLTQNFIAQGYMGPGGGGTREAWYYPHTPDSANFALERACINAPDGGENISVSYQDAAQDNTFPFGGVRYSGRLNNTYDANSIYLYSLKVIDSGGQLNVNSHISAQSSQTASNITLFRLVRALAKACGFAGPTSMMAAIPPGSNTEADQIAMTALGGVNWSAWTHGLSEGDIYSTTPLPRRWESRQTLEDAVRNLGLNTTNTDRFLNNITISSWIDRSTCKVNVNPAAPPATSLPPVYLREARSPININSASEELLTALLWELQAQPIYLNNLGTRNKSSNSTDGLNDIQEIRDVSCVPTRSAITMFAGNPGNDLTRARNFARDIINQREHPVNGPFKSWGDFDMFIDNQNSGQLPTDGTDWSNNYNPPNDPGNLGSTVWLQTRRDLIKAHFNPNTVEHHFNPNRYSRYRTCKSDFYDSTMAANQHHTHRTEFCCFSSGMFEVSAIGFVVAASTNQILSRTQFRTEVSILDITKHTTQQDFENAVSGNPVLGTTTTYPNVMNRAGYTADTYTGTVEPLIAVLPTAGTTYASDFPTARPTSTTINVTTSLASNSMRFNAWAGLVSTLVGASPQGIRSSAGANLANDGLISHRLQYDSLATTRFFSIAGLDTGAQGVVRGMNYPGWSGNTTNPRVASSGDRIPYYRGSLEFWAKLTEPSDAQIPCGLFSATLVNRNPTYSSSSDRFAFDFPTSGTAFSEGVQFYIYKNNAGQLRFSRIYFCLAYNNAGGFIGTHYRKDADAWDYNADYAAPDYPNGNAAGWLSQATSDRLYFPVPRRDVLINSNELTWNPNVWHRIAISWDDADGDDNADGGMDIWIDGVAQNHAVQKCSDTNTVNDPEFILLNETEPRDCMNINGFFRPQFQADDGLFKLENAAVYIPGNATMANVRIYTPPVAPWAPNATYPFSSTATYTQNFIITQGGRLGTLCWTAYPSRKMGGTSTFVTVSARVLDGATQLGSFDSSPLANTANGYDGDGLPLGGLIVPPNTRIEYTVTFNQSLPRNECSTLDDITVIVINPTVLSLEEIL